jgi:hypothetical protein
LQEDEDFNSKPTAKIVWLGGKPSIEILPNQKRKFVGIDDTFHEKKKASFKPVKRRELGKCF